MVGLDLSTPKVLLRLIQHFLELFSDSYMDDKTLDRLLSFMARLHVVVFPSIYAYNMPCVDLRPLRKD